MPDYSAEVVSVDTGESVEAPETVESPTETVDETQVETVETTNEETTEEAPEVVEETTDEASDTLVKLPDGRELPKEQAEVEMRNLYSEFTRKSQRLATYEKGDKPITNKVEDTQEEEWIPETADDIVQKVKSDLIREQEEAKQNEIAQKQAVEESVTQQLEEIKSLDSSLNETQLFNHAIKYGFTDLKQAHSNMKDMYSAINKVKQETVNNVKKRNADPVNGVSQSGNVVDGDAYDPSVRNMSAVDYLNSLNN